MVGCIHEGRRPRCVLRSSAVQPKGLGRTPVFARRSCDGGLRSVSVVPLASGIAVIDERRRSAGVDTPAGTVVASDDCVPG